MTELDHVTQLVALTLGVAWASGINLYAAVLALGLLSATGHVDLPSGLQVLDSPLVIGAAGIMYIVEFFADKIPGVDSAWDVLHTFVRIPAGAALAASATMNVDPSVAVAAGLLGGAVAGSMHLAKAGTRLLINASPEPFSNSIASLTEDAAVFGGIWLMTQHPVWFLVLFAAGAVAFVLLLPRIWRGVRLLFSRIASFLRGRGDDRNPAGPVGGDRVAALPGPGDLRWMRDHEQQRPTV